MAGVNAVRSGDADRFTDVATTADLSACEAPDNVGLRYEEEERNIQQPITNNY